MRAVRIDEMQRRNLLSRCEAAAGQAWLGDWLECGRSMAAAAIERRTGCALDDPDVMRSAARARLRQAVFALDGEQSPTFRVARAVVIEDRTAAEVSGELGIRPGSATDLLRLGLRRLAERVYRFTESA